MDDLKDQQAASLYKTSTSRRKLPKSIEIDSLLAAYLEEAPGQKPEPPLAPVPTKNPRLTQEMMASEGQTEVDLGRISRIQSQLGRYIRQAGRNNNLVGVMFIELNSLREVARTLGRASSRVLASQATRRLTELLGSRGVVASMATETLVVLAPDLKESDEAATLADEIHHELTRSYNVAEGAVYMDCAIGLALYPDHGTAPAQLLNNADAALSRTGESTGDFFKSYDAVEHADDTERLLIKTALHNAIQGDEFRLRFQPRISVETGELLGAEVLLRWHNPVLGSVSPADFIPVAEETGHILTIGRWVLEEAVTQYRRWLDAGYKLPVLSVNISNDQLERGGLLDILEEIKVHELPGGLLELELTESLMMGSSARSRDTLNALKARGVRLAVDDFGTGYSALSYLTDLPVTVVKLDEALVRNIHTSSSSATLVKSILKMAHDLNLWVVAEGVEQPDQLELLRTLGCDEVQGFLVGTPVTAKEMEKLLSRSGPTL